MATEGIEGTPRDYAFVSISIVANVVLYGLAGAVLWGIKHLFRYSANN